MSWWTGNLWVFWLFYQALNITFLVNAETCNKDMVFKVTLEGKTLANHVFKTVRATNDAHCQSKCFLDDRCISYNFGSSASEETAMCELSDSDHFMHPEDLVDRPGVIYRSAQNTCNCSKNSTCRYNFVDNTHRCECKPGFTGDLCQTNIDECASNPCQNEGSCQDQVNSYNCTCAAGFTGVNCQTDIDECAAKPCQNQSTCIDLINDYKCSCPEGSMGKNCSIKFDWLKVGSSVCIETRNDRYGKIFVPSDFEVLNFKLVYVSGEGLSFAGNDKKAFWGGTFGDTNKIQIQIHITDANNTRISPSPDIELIDNYGQFAYKLPGVTTMDPELTLPDLSPPLPVKAGQEFRIWFGQDLVNKYESDNEGKTCADVWVRKY